MKDCLEILANVASIATALLAAFFFCQYHCRIRKKRIKLEEYLKNDKMAPKPGLTGKRTVVHLMGRLKFTEDEVFQACFQSDHIACKQVTDPATGRATELLFEYDENLPT
jgi:hypothetical protein